MPAETQDLVAVTKRKLANSQRPNASLVVMGAFALAARTENVVRGFLIGVCPAPIKAETGYKQHYEDYVAHVPSIPCGRPRAIVLAGFSPELSRAPLPWTRVVCVPS